MLSASQITSLESNPNIAPLYFTGFSRQRKDGRFLGQRCNVFIRSRTPFSKYSRENARQFRFPSEALDTLHTCILRRKIHFNHIPF